MNGVHDAPTCSITNVHFHGFVNASPFSMESR
jgi:hypothetical protein